MLKVVPVALFIGAAVFLSTSSLHDTRAEAAFKVPVVTVKATDFAFSAPKSIAAGQTTFRLVNDGKELHHITILKLGAGKTMKDVEAAMKTPPSRRRRGSWPSAARTPRCPAPPSRPRSISPPATTCSSASSRRQARRFRMPRLEARAPDITLEIAAPENDGRSFEVRLDTPLMRARAADRDVAAPGREPGAGRRADGAVLRRSEQRERPPGFAARSRPRVLRRRAAAVQGDVLEADRRRAPAPQPLRRLGRAQHPVGADDPDAPNGRGRRARPSPLGVELAVGRWHRQT